MKGLRANKKKQIRRQYGLSSEFGSHNRLDNSTLLQGNDDALTVDKTWLEEQLKDYLESSQESAERVIKSGMQKPLKPEQKVNIQQTKLLANSAYV